MLASCSSAICIRADLQLATRSDAYRAYHARDLERTARYLDVPFRGVPKQYYPQKAGDIQLAAQVIIRMQQRYGIGSEEALRYTLAVQETIWYTEEADHCDIEFLRTLARRIGLEEEDVSALVVDKRDDMEDPAVIEWDENYKEAIALGERLMRGSCRVTAVTACANTSGVIGTPNYVVNGEVYWGQDRLNHVEAHIKGLVREGAVPYVYA